MIKIASIIESLQAKRTYLGIELGSTRIKAVLIDESGRTIAYGDHSWENRLEEGFWTYSLEDVWSGIQDAYSALADQVKADYGVVLNEVGAIGISGMMHGYLVFDEEGELLVPFRTWRNNLQLEASTFLTEQLSYPIPQRWSIAHLYQGMLNHEPHVERIAHQTTLAGYIHWQLTGQKVLGVGEASGMFPIDLTTKRFNQKMVLQFEQLSGELGYALKLDEILPRVLVAGDPAGGLTESGAKLLDPSGNLKSGIPLCPPEGDAGTGMVATNTIKPKTGNVSAGTSIFGMIVLEDDLEGVHPEIDQVTTPSGNLVAMAHANNCTSDLNAWVSLFGEMLTVMGVEYKIDDLYETLYRESLAGEADAGGILSYGYLSGEHITHFEEGRPLVVRMPETQLSLANFMKAHLFSALGALKVGLDVLLKEEKVQLDTLLGHGGLFKTPGVGQRYLSAAAGVPVSVMANTGEGGPWGMALLAAYSANGAGRTLETYLDEVVYADMPVEELMACQEEIQGFERFMTRYKFGLSVERAAVENLSFKLGKH